MRALFLLVGLSSLSGQTVNQPARPVGDPGVVTTGQAITPAGVQSTFLGRVYGAQWSPGGDSLWVLNASDVYELDWRNNRVLTHFAHGGLPGAQAIQVEQGSGRPLIATSVKNQARLMVYENKV